MPLCEKNVLYHVSNMKKTEDEEEMKSVGQDKDTQMGFEGRENKGPCLKAVKGVSSDDVMKCRQRSTVRKKVEPAGAVDLHNQYAPLVSCN